MLLRLVAKICSLRCSVLKAKAYFRCFGDKNYSNFSVLPSCCMIEFSSFKNKHIRFILQTVFGFHILADCKSGKEFKGYCNLFPDIEIAL